MPKILISLFCLLFSNVFCSVANVTKDINMRFKDVRQGLSHQTVNCFYQDEFGFLWIGTQDGLNRYDGRKFEVFKPDNTNLYSINVNNIRQICGNGEGLLFIRGLQSVTIYDMRLNRFKMLCDCEISGIYYAQKTLWVATRKEIYRYTDLEQKPELFFSFAEEKAQEVSITNLMVCKDGMIVVGTSTKGVLRIHPSGKIVHQVDVGAVNSITEDRNKTIWLATRNRGLTRWEANGKLTHYRHTKVADNGINHDNVRHVTQANDSLIYIGTYAGLQTLNLSSGEFTNYNYDLSVEAADIRSIISMFHDRSGTLWLGTFYQGIQYYNVANDVYHFYRPSTTVSGRSNTHIISSITEDNSGRVWLGSEGGGLTVYDKSKKQFSTFENLYQRDISSKIVKSLYYEKEENTLWVASLHQGINRINLSNGRIDYISEEVHDTRGQVIDKTYNVLKIMEFKGRDSLLLATKSGLLVLNKKTLRLYPFEYQALSKHRSQVWDMAFDGDGDLWLTTSFDLLRIHLEDASIQTYSFATIAQSKAQHHINHILCDTKERIWLGSTGSGIYLFDRQNDCFTGYGNRQGLDNGFITGLVETPSDGSIYVATNAGLSKFNPETKTFENYNRQSDFPLNNVNDGGLYITSDHNIYAAGLSGIVSIAQEKLNKQSVDYRVFIKQLYVDNAVLQPLDSLALITQSTLYERKLVLPPHYSSITFEIATNILNNIAHVGLEYKLDGFDHDYIKADDKTMITYTNLNPGRYLFHVRGYQPHTNNSNAPCTDFELIIEAPIYKRGWFITLVVLAIGFLIWYIIRLYWLRKSLQHSLLSEKREKESIEHVNQSKLRFFTNISHEFRTPLTLITSQLEMLLMHKEMIPDIYNKMLDIYKNSRRMNYLVDEVIDIRKQEQGYLKLRVSKEDIVEVLKDIYYSFYSYAQLNKIDLQFSSQVKEADLYIDRYQMEKVFYNLLSNAFKYTPTGEWIAIELSTEGEHDILISVSNRGTGIEKDKLKYVFERFWQDQSATTINTVKGSGIGLAISKGIVELHQGTIEVESEPHGVTRFTVRLHRNAVIEAEVVPSQDEHSADAYTFEPQEISEMVKPNKEVKILIVEDNTEMRKVLKSIFEQIYDVYTAADGKEGFELACSLQPQIIVSDIMMPIMSGLEMCEKLKSNLQTSHIPIVLLTAHNSEEHTLEGLQTGADDYIPKPFKIKILVARCNNIVQTRQLLQQRFAKHDEVIGDECTLNPIDKKILSDAVAIVESYIDNADFDVATFSRELGMSRTLLFTKLKALTGQTPNEFILSLRLKQATEKLKNDPTALIADIAFDYGFSNASYFIRCFKNEYGITPAAYRKNSK